MNRILFVIAAIVALLAPATAQQPPIEAYGNLPGVSHVSISPDGKYLAFILRLDEDTNQLRTLNLETEQLAAIDIGQLRSNGVFWASPRHIVFRAFENTRLGGYSGRFQYSAAFAINVDTNKYQRLLDRTENLYPAQSGLGQIIGRLEGSEDIFMPAFMGTRDPSYDVLRVDLDTGRGRRHLSGERDGVGWVVDTDGQALVEETYDNDRDMHVVRARVDGRWKTVYEKKKPEGPTGVVGVDPDRTGVIFHLDTDDGFSELRILSFDGTVSEALFSRPSTEISRVLRNENQIVFGVQYGGLRPAYAFFDPKLSADMDMAQANFPETSVWLESWTDDFSKLIIRVAGTGNAGNYYFFDRQAMTIKPISSSHPDIPAEAVGDVLTIEYKARDGLTIPGILTVQRGMEMANLPLIVMPHGGPERHDQVGFDWMAQYFANRGYLVLQPNFRGSDGFGRAFTEAGYGEWGGAMQHDITDGVTALVEAGYADPLRICIIGWSYGGYAALAGGAFTPELYRCVAAIAPVTDLRRMVFEEKGDHGSDHWVIGYWEKAMAGGNATRELLDERSPARFAENFAAPVMLIHGRDDLIVRVGQSRRMRRALEDAGKPVEFVELRGEDHSLSTPGARLEALRALDAFVTRHLGPGAVPATPVLSSAE